MLLFPNCKINIGLNIIRKREDGFHDLETIFYPIKKQFEALEILQVYSENTMDQQAVKTTHQPSAAVNFSITGLTIAGDSSNNLCVKAYHLLKKDFPNLPAIQMHLHKVIPMGAGLGGGSADGAFALQLLNDKFELGLLQNQLIDYALQLGSDCPFFIYNQPCFGQGRGEILTPIELDLSAYYMVLVNPNIHINTGWAFGHIKPQQPKKSLKELIQQPIQDWKHTIINDFEAAVILAHPTTADIKNKLYTLGATYAAMSGSGSTFFGLFEKKQFDAIILKKEINNLMPAYWHWLEA